MAWITDDLIHAGKLSIDGAGPIALGRFAEDDHWTAVRRIPIVHLLQYPDDLVIVVAIGYGEDIPAIRCPLIDQAIALKSPMNHAANQRIIDPGIVIGEEDPEPLANLERDGLRLQFLRVAGAHGEFAFECDDLR